ncbi:MAG: peptidoglycan DD-metalloendopeptidase family protein [Salinibacter sp.]
MPSSSPLLPRPDDMQHLAANLLPILLGASLLVGCQVGSTAPSSETNGSDTQAEVQTDPFGIRAGRYTVKTGRVGRAETFSDLVDAYGVDYQTILALSEAARPAFDVQDLRVGRPYRVYVNPWLQKAQYVVYQISPVRYVLFDIRRPERTRIETRSVTHRWATVSGTVNGSLYESLVNNGGHPLLALRLSEVFAWQIDFFRLRAGDQFRLVYEKRSIGGTPVQPGEIVAAYVRHRGEDYYAFRFKGGETEAEYFNRQGQSLRRQLLKAPLQYSRISSGFTDRRYHPILKEYRPHHGVDYAAPRGTPVRSVGDGVVQFAGYDGPNGNYVKIRHNGTYTSGYLHLSDIAVARGESVDQGETIGYVGSTGRSTGPHLDYRLWKHGTAVNPYTLELPPSQPVPLVHRDAFRKTVDALLPYLRGRTELTYAQAWSGRENEKAPTGAGRSPALARSRR